MRTVESLERQINGKLGELKEWKAGRGHLLDSFPSLQAQGGASLSAPLSFAFRTQRYTNDLNLITEERTLVILLCRPMSYERF